MTTEAHDAVIAAPNYLNTDFYDVVISGGHWSATNHVDKLRDELLSEVAQTASAGASATVLDVDLGSLRNIKFIGFPDSNVSREGRIKTLISDTPAWSGLVLKAVATAAAATIQVRSTGAVTLRIGDVFSIAGDKDSNGWLHKYAFGEATTLTTGGSCTMALLSTMTASVIASTYASGAALTCHTGDFSTAVVSSVYNGDYEDWWPVVYADGAQSWPFESWDGKLSEEKAQDFPKQYFKVFDDGVLGRYVRHLIEDTGNTDGFVELAGYFLAEGWYGDVYLELGASLGWDTTTTMQRSKANAKHYNRGVQYRRLVFTVPNVQVDTALQQAADMVKRIGMHRQVYMVIDKDDAANRHRLCFVGHLSKLDPQTFINFDANSVPFSIEEDTEGEL